MPIHNHIPSMIVDDDTIPLFSIDSVSREIICNSEDEIIIMQNDANSERLTFEIDELIEGHNMMDCNVVQIHYINTGANGTGQTVNIYNVNDLSIIPTKPGKLKFSWLVSRNATKFIGNVRFAVRFFCTNSAEPQQEGDPVEGQILYEWSTGVSSAIIIGESIRNNTEIEDAIKLDILSGLKQQLMGDFQWVSDPSNPEATEPTFLQFTDKEDNVITSVNLKSSVKGDKGDKGDTPTISVGTVKTTDLDDPEPSVEVEHMDDDNNPTLKFVLPQPARNYVSVTDSEGKSSDMRFFVGTQAEYDALTEDQKKVIFALITDDPTFEDTVGALKEEIKEEISGEIREENRFTVYRYRTEDSYSSGSVQFGGRTFDTFTPSEVGYLERTMHATAVYEYINDIEIPINGDLVTVYEHEGVKGYPDFNLELLARIDEDGNGTDLITRWHYKPGITYSGGLLTPITIDTSLFVKSGNSDVINNDGREIFETDLTGFIEWLNLKQKVLKEGCYILDDYKNLYRVVEMTTGSNTVKLLGISVKNKKYCHYINFYGIRTWSVPSEGRELIKIAFSYISNTKNITSIDDVYNDLTINYITTYSPGTEDTEDGYAYIPAVGVYRDNDDETASETYMLEIFRRRRILDGSTDTSHIYACRNGFANTIGGFDLVNGMSYNEQNDFHCTTIEL